MIDQQNPKRTLSIEIRRGMNSQSTPEPLADERVQTRGTAFVNSAASDRSLLLVMRLSAFLCFAGWTWVHYYWEGPYGVLLWQDSTYNLALKFGIPWDEFVGSGADDGLVQKWLARVWWLYLLCTILTLIASRRSKMQLTVLIGGSGLLAVLSYAKYVAALRQPPMFFEHGGQMLMPVLLVLALVWGVRHRITVGTAIVAFVMTFAGHGAYAVNLWPTPATFHAMTSLILQVEYDTAQTLLCVAGVLDFLICIGIFISPVRHWCALYAAVWGLLTAFARPVAGMSWDLNYWGADQFLHETVLRAPHCLIPLYLFLLWHQPQPRSRTSPNSTDKEIS